jgi:hypothetical protein
VSRYAPPGNILKHGEGGVDFLRCGGIQHLDLPSQGARRALFTPWTGKEVTTEIVRSLPDQYVASPGDAWNARDVLLKLPRYAKQLPNPEALPPSLSNLALPARL